MDEGDIVALLGLDGVIAGRQEAAHEIRNNLIRIKKSLRLQFDPFLMLDDKQFKRLYRLTKPVADNLIDLLQPMLGGGTASRLSAKTQTMIALRTFATGGYQSLVAQDFLHPSCQASVSNCVTAVIDALNDLAPTFIKFPRTPQERWVTQRRFREFNRISGILGVMDCVVIKMLKPHQNEESFYNFKHRHAMNVQVVSDANFMITDLRICPGSNNDQSIWNHSDIKDYMERLRSDPYINRQEGQFYLLGDSGYTPSPVLLTPVHDADPRSPEALYTREHCRTRCRIEQLFGMWLNMWRILKRERAMRYAPRKAAKIIVACAVLHNFQRLNGLYPDDYEDVVDGQQGYEPRFFNFQQGILERQQLIDDLYTLA